MEPTNLRGRHPCCYHLRIAVFSKIKDMALFRIVNLTIVLIVMAFKRYAFTSFCCAYAARWIRSVA
jgi:hypothetical protein